MAESLGLPVEGMTLANVSDGELEKQFQDCLVDAIEIFNEDDKYQLDKEDCIHVRIQCDVVLSLNIASGVAHVSAVAGLKPPKRKQITRAAFVKNGVVLVMPEEQPPLLENVHKIKKGDKE